MRQYYVAVSTREAKLTTLVELLQALQSDSGGGAGGSGVALAVACGSRDALDEVVSALLACETCALAVLHSDMSLSEIEAEVVRFKERAAPQQQQQHQQHQHQQRHQQQQQGQQRQQDGDRPSSGPEPLTRQQEGGGAAPDAAGSAGVQAAGVPAASPAEAPSACADGDRDRSGGDGGGSPGTSSGGPHDSSSLVLATTDVCLKALPKELLPLGLPLLVQYDIPPTKEVFTRRVAAAFGASKERRRTHHRAVVIDFIAAGEMPAFRARERFSTAPVLEMPVHVPDVL